MSTATGWAIYIILALLVSTIMAFAKVPTWAAALLGLVFGTLLLVVLAGLGWQPIWWEEVR